jgi:hypothetical protein
VSQQRSFSTSVFYALGRRIPALIVSGTLVPQPCRLLEAEDGTPSTEGNSTSLFLAPGPAATRKKFARSHLYYSTRRDLSIVPIEPSRDTNLLNRCPQVLRCKSVSCRAWATESESSTTGRHTRKFTAETLEALPRIPSSVLTSSSLSSCNRMGVPPSEAVQALSAEH